MHHANPCMSEPTLIWQWDESSYLNAFIFTFTCMPVCTPFLTQGFTLISHSCLYNGRLYSNRSKTRYLPLLHSRIVHVCHLPGPIAKCVSAIDFQIANKCKILENPASDASPLFYFAAWHGREIRFQLSRGFKEVTQSCPREQLYIKWNCLVATSNCSVQALNGCSRNIVGKRGFILPMMI